MNLHIKLLPIAFFLFIGIQQVAAQNVVTQNNVEFIEKKANDLNSIRVPKKKMSKEAKKNMPKLNKEILTMNNLDKFVKKRKKLRFRSKRRPVAEKCFKETECHDETSPKKEKQ